jgi:hypothetical protein
MLLAVVDLAKSLGLTATPGGVELDGIPISQDDIEDERCKALLSCISDAVAAIQTLTQQGLDLFRSLLHVGAGINSLSAGAQFSTCLGSLGLGLKVSLNLAIGLPFQMQAFSASFTAAITAVSAAVQPIKALLCIPNALVQLLFGGICGFKPFQFNLCPPPPDLSMLLDRLNDLVVLSTMMIGQLVSALQIMKTDLNHTTSVASDLKFASQCATVLIPVGIALGLTGKIPIEASASVQVPGVGGVSATVAGGTVSGGASVTAPTGQQFTSGGAFKLG